MVAKAVLAWLKKILREPSEWETKSRYPPISALFFCGVPPPDDLAEKSPYRFPLIFAPKLSIFLPKNRQTMIFKAIEFAAKAHAGQFRKQTRVPYIVHPIGVAKLLLEHGCDETVAIAAILHDTVEDTGVTLPDIREAFGERVSALVRYATEPDKSCAWELRKQHTLDLIPTAPMEALLLICADKLDNLRSIYEDSLRIGDDVWSRFNRPRKKQQWYFESLVSAFMRRTDGEPSHPLFSQLEREVQRVFGDPDDKPITD